MSHDCPRLVLDCSYVRQMDRSVIHLLLCCLQEALRQNGDVKLAALSPAAKVALQLAGADRVFEIHDTASHAVDSFFHPAARLQSTLEAWLEQFGMVIACSAGAALRLERHMRISTYWLQRQIAGCMAILLTVPLGAQSQQPLSAQQEGTSSVGHAEAYGQPAAQTTQSAPEDTPSETPRANSTNQASPQTVPHPVGTAAAPYEKTLGVAVSRPAGAVIAPAKQRRSHSLLIKVGLLVAGAAAIGTVVVLSNASPSRPN